MKTIKRIIALLMIAAMLLSFAACHEKDEIAVTIGDYEFTSAYYMCVLINCDGQAQQKATEIARKDNNIDTSKDDFYLDVKIDGKDYKTYVKDQAIETLKEVALYKAKCKEAKLELDADTKATAQYYAQAYWSSYGYADIYEPNGVSLATYTDYMVDSSYVDLYFEHLYGEGGEKEISKEELTKKLLADYDLTNMVFVSYASLTDEEKAKEKEKLETSKDELIGNKKTFETVYYEYNEKPEEDKTETTDEDTSSETGKEENKDDNKDEDKEDEKEELKPLDSLASVVGSDETSYSFPNFDEVKKMKVGEIKLIDDTTNKRLYLVVKKDIEADPYYIDMLDGTIRNALKGEEFDKDMNAQALKLEAKINDFAVDRFDVDDIEYPESDS